MTFETKLNELYSEIAQQVSDMIPVEWNELYFNGEVKVEEGGVFFFFIPVQHNNEFVYSHDIPDLYQINDKVYDEELRKLFKQTIELQKVFIDNDQEPCFSVTLIVNSLGNLKVHFDYTNWFESDFGPAARIRYFEYKYLDYKQENSNLELMKRMKEFEENK